MKQHTYMLYQIDEEGLKIETQISEAHLAKFMESKEDNVIQMAENLTKFQNNGRGRETPARHLYKIEKIEAEVIYTNNTGNEHLCLKDLKCKPIKINLW